MKTALLTAASACLLLTACAQAHIGYSPLPNVHVSVPLKLPSPGKKAAGNLPAGHGGHYKTGKPYQVAGRWYYPLPSASGYDRTGIASWYGRDFHGRKTANGEHYDMHALSAAHKTLPLPTLVRVTNRENGRFVIVRVNDRGPFAKKRLIDLSYAAARALGFAEKGTVRVRVQAISSRPKQQWESAVASIPSSPSRPSGPRQSDSGGVMYVQLGAFSSASNAERLKDALANDYPAVRILKSGEMNPVLYRVRIGPFADASQIEQTVVSLRNQGYRNTIVVIE
jgi:rare lipoprotein A